MRGLRFLFHEPHAFTNAYVVTYLVLLILVSITLLVFVIWDNERPLRKGLVFLSLAVPFFGALAAHFFAPQADDDCCYVFISLLSLIAVANIAALVQIITTI